MKLIKLNISLLVAFTIFNSCSKDVSINTPQEIQHEIAKIYIDSKPSNANIFIDGKNSGKSTPDTITYLSNDVHEITLKMYLFQDVKFNISADSNHITKYYHDYYAYPENFASINIVSSPNSAAILFDDTLLTQKTPFLLKDIYPGNHKIKITYPEHRADSVELFFRGGTKTELDFSLIDTTIWVTYNKYNSPFKSYYVNDIYVDRDDKVWIATSDSGIYKFNNNKWEVLNSYNSVLYVNYINKIEEDQSGNLWFCTNKGLFKYNFSNWDEFTTFNSNLPTNVIFDISFGDNDHAWLGTQKGLVFFDGNNFKTYNLHNSKIPSDFVTDVYQNNEGNIWLGTAGNGLAYFIPSSNSWLKEDASTTLFGNSIYDITIDKYGTVWAAIKPEKPENLTGAICKRADDGFWGIVVPGDIYNKVNSFCFDTEKNLIINTSRGMIWYKDKQNFVTYNSDTKNLPINNVSSVAFDSKGNMWIGTIGGGIIKYKTWNDPEFK